jgi:hypothetical protein
MKEREIQVTADQIHKLITEVRALPSTPIGDHLSDDEFIGYTMETLEPQQMERIDAHLASCPECATEMERLVEASEVWRGEKGEQRLAELWARTIEKTQVEAVAGEGGDLINSNLHDESPPKPASKPSWWRQFFWRFRSPKAIPQGFVPIISDLARRLVTDLAPHELPLFPPVSDAYFRDPQAVFAGRGYKEDMLGFGLETGKVLLTPVALAVVTELVQLVGQRAMDTVEEEETTSTLATLRLGPEQLSQIHKRAFETACQLKLPESQARSLANALVENLTVIDS